MEEMYLKILPRIVHWMACFDLNDSENGSGRLTGLHLDLLGDE